VLTLYLYLQPFLLFCLRQLARFSTRLEELIAAREGLMERWRKADLGKNRVWIHVSSVGELEQARPVIEHLNSRGFHVVLTYFSTSVPKLVRDWSFVRFADYLPFDQPEQMAELVSLVRPRALVLNRYDLWPCHILACKKAGIPVVLINASTPPLGWFGRLSLYARRSLFFAVDGWTFVDAAAAAAWEPFLSEAAKGLVAGNPRVDRALARAEQLISTGKAKVRLSRWQKRDFCLVAGSTWPGDEVVLLDAWERLGDQQPKRSLVVVPHEPDPAHLKRVEAELSKRGLSWIRFSALEESNARLDTDVLLVDQRGSLAEIYGLGDLAYVGGGFGKQIHSIIEPVAHGKLVAFGPHFHRTPEAYTLKAVGAACALTGPRKALRLASWMLTMSQAGEERARAAESLRVFLQMHKGAGDRVGQFVEAQIS
jgi:3-deoxy-D-manno-octulosonic-acid transferase